MTSHKSLTSTQAYIKRSTLAQTSEDAKKRAQTATVTTGDKVKQRKIDWLGESDDDEDDPLSPRASPSALVAGPKQLSKPKPPPTTKPQTNVKQPRKLED